jgi:hypothetical protein
MVKQKGEEPASRGIPSKKSLWFEYSKLPMAVTARWEAEDVLQIVFPAWAQKAQYDIACKLVRFLSERDNADGDAIAQWAGERQIPNSTLRNLVIPKLIRCGLVSRERVNPTGETEKDKKHKMVLSLSTKFGESFKHIGGEWNALVETWKIKRRK